jgi:REP element-mobilizing transposase RayT
MSQSFSRVLVHLVFSTKRREPLITPVIQPQLHAYLAGTLNGIECPAIRVGGVEDHVHCLFALSRNWSIKEVVEKTKTSSSKWIKSHGPQFRTFHWQAGYGAFSIGQSGLEEVVAYIRNQAEHHKSMNFQDEYRALLERYEVEYDERYVWD